MKVPSLNYHRRHGLRCEGKHRADTQTSEPEERKKGWARCSCPIYASGSLNRVARKFATKQKDWQAAARMMAPYLAANSWDLERPPTPPDGDGHKLPAAPAKTVVAIDRATKAYLAEHERAQSAHGTLRKYRYLMASINAFSADVGLRHVDEWTPALVRQFRDTWAVSPLTASKTLGNLKSFFEFCAENEWIGQGRNPARIKTRSNRALRADDSVQRQKLPFTNDELERMCAACADYGKSELRTWPKKKDGRQVEAITDYRDYRRVWTGDDLEDFIQISVYTGLRISDVATFDIARLRDTGEVEVRTTKSGSKVYTWIPDWLADRIRARAARIGPLIFGKHRTADLNVITDSWRRKLIALWANSGPWSVHPTPHRFRHTFARILLENNVPVSTVAELMGNTETIVRKHYAAWVPGRQQKTTAILQDAFRGAPNPSRPQPSKVRNIR